MVKFHKHSEPYTKLEPEVVTPNVPTTPAAKSTMSTKASPTKTLKSANVWTVFMPPPVNSVKGHLLPKVLSGNRKRRISVETHLNVHDLEPTADTSASNTKTTTGASNATSSDDEKQKQYSEKKANERVIIRILAPVLVKDINIKTDLKMGLVSPKKFAGKSSLSHALRHRHSDGSESISTIGPRGVEDGKEDSTYNISLHTDINESSTQQVIAEEMSMPPKMDAPPGWVQKYNFVLRNFNIKKRVKSACVVTTKNKKVEQTREIIFDSEADAIDFCNLIEFYKTRDETKAVRLFRDTFAGNEGDEEKPLQLLFEIVSAWDLGKSDLLPHPDPYVIASLHDEVIHKTKHIHFTSDPIWTLDTGSLFLLNTTPKELFMSKEGVMFEVRDYDHIGAGTSLGFAWFSPKELYHANGKRIERRLYARTGERHSGKGYIAIRCRIATVNDKLFLSQYNEKRSLSESVNNHLQLKSESSVIKHALHMTKKKNRDGTKLNLVRPGPDEDNRLDTEWLTKDQVEECSQKESKKWIDLGSGKLGRVFVEIIGCDDLPNLDHSVLIPGSSDKTDAFVSIVYEDSAAFTDVIDDCLSPRWMPWSRRAFIFRMMHPSSQIFLAVFDHDQIRHDVVGRASIDITNLKPNTIYNLHYALNTTTKLNKRKSKGSINIRIRVEFTDGDERQAFIQSLKLPPRVYFNCKSRKEFHVIHDTATEKFCKKEFDLRILNSYIEELSDYLELQVYVRKAIETVLLWRGTYEVTFHIPTLPSSQGFTKKVSLFLPLNSVASFVIGVLYVERPMLGPSLFLTSIALMLISMKSFRKRNPNPWMRGKTFSELLQIFIFGKSLSPPVSIMQNENIRESTEYEEYWTQEMLQLKERAKKRREEALRVSTDYIQQLDEIGDTDTNIATQTHGPDFGLNIFKPMMYPLQYYLGIVCEYCRFIRNILMWEECYFSFWICIGCIILAVAFLFVPWDLVLHWSFRIIVWSLLGPWMKLVDIFYTSKHKPLSNEEEKAKIELNRKLREQVKNKLVREARIKRENAGKLKAMKTYLFGKFTTYIPILKQERYIDFPLPESYAKPYESKKLSLGELAMQEGGKNCERVDGQQLVGDMIQVRVKESISQAQQGRFARNTALLLDNNVASGIAGDSTKGAIVKISSLAGVAGIASWYAVPILIEGIRWITESH